MKMSKVKQSYIVSVQLKVKKTETTDKICQDLKRLAKTRKPKKVGFHDLVLVLECC